MELTFDEKNEGKALDYSTEGEAADMFKGCGYSEDYAEDSPPCDGWISPQENAEKNCETFFSFIRENHLHEAQEFRRQGYNSQEPEVDPGLLPQLRDAVDVASRLVHLHTSEEERLGQWLREQIRQLEKFFKQLSGSVIKEWVNDELTKERLVPSGLDASLNKSAAQSLVRRLESTLQTLTRAARALGSIVDYSTPDNLHGAVHEVLVNELTDAISPGDRESVTQALRRMMADAADNAAWSRLMDARVATWEVNKPATFGTVIDAVRRDADKANKKARELSGSAQAFLSDIAAYLLRLSIEIKTERSALGKGAVAETTGKTQDDKTVTLFQELKTSVRHGRIKLGIVGTTVSKYGRGVARVMQYGDTTATPSKTADRGVANSIIRSILWQWQQPAIKLQHASGAILAKVAELKKIQSLFTADAAANAPKNAEESDDIAASEPHDVDTQVRQWVNERIEREQPSGQQVEKLAVLSQLLDGDIANARRLVARLGKTQSDIDNMLKRQRVAVVNMIYERRSANIDTALKDVDKALPKIARDLGTAVAALDRALQAAEQPTRDFAAAQTQANEAQLLATKAKESISTRSIWLTERPLDEQSRGARLAKHWANLAKERNPGHWQAPDARRVWASLKKQRLLDATLSSGDPEGYLFATRFAGELENAGNDELKLPMSPDEYVALEKSLVEFIVSWGQKRVTRGTTRVVIELIFEQAVDGVTFSLSSIIRAPYKILKASIKIPYRINKINNYTMPGQDRPYKAIYGMLGKKLKQLGFNLVTAPLPGIIKLPMGAGIATGAVLYNRRMESREKTFSAVYETVTQGKKSEKIKMSSLTGMAVDSVMDASFMSGFKGARKGIASLRSGSGIPEEINVQLMPPTVAGETLTPLRAEDALLRIANTGDPELRTLAARLLMQPDIDRVPLWQSNLSDHSRYSLSGRWIKLGADASDWEIMHEITHGLTAEKLRYGLAHPDSELGKWVSELDALRRNALTGYQGKDQQTQYYLTNLDEFVAGLYSGNKHFINHLQTLRREGRSLLKCVIEGICLLLGLLPEQESALSRAMGLADEIMQAQSVAPEDNVAGELYSNVFGGQYSNLFDSGIRKPASPSPSQASSRSSAVDWQTFNGNVTSSADSDALLAWLAALTPQARRAWFSSRDFESDFDKNLKIYLAEKYFIYDDPVPGTDFFAWVSKFKKWPPAFQRDNRVVGILRDIRSPADFPAGKGFMFTLRDDAGGIIFSKKYVPDANVVKSGLWHTNILDQITSSMNDLPESQRIYIAHITEQSYNTQQPALSQGATPDNVKNVFVTKPNSEVASADFRFIDADENSVSITAALYEQEEAQQQPRNEQSDPLVGAGKVNDYFLEKDDVTADIRRDTLIWTTITGSNIDPDERNEAYSGFVYIWEAGKPGRRRLTVGQYLSDDIYVSSKYQMMILPRDHLFADENSTPTEEDRRWPTLETLYQSNYIRQLHLNIFTEASDDDLEAMSSQEKSEQVAEGKTHTQGTKSWETDNQQRFSLQGERDLIAGEKVLVSVTNEQGLVEYIEIAIPAARLSRHRWPAYVAAKINSEMRLVRVGDSAGQGQTASIGVKTSGENYLWTTNGQVVEWQILRGGPAAVLPGQGKPQWRVPASETWKTTPPRLALPRPTSADERLVIWVEDRKSGVLIERLEVPGVHEPNEAKLSQEINKSSSHLRAGILSQGEIVPTDATGGSFFWVDNDDYIVKYALVPAEILNKNLQLIQRFQLLKRINTNPEKTRYLFSSGRHHPYTALDTAEINRLLALPKSDIPLELSKTINDCLAAGISKPEMNASEQWVNSETALIKNGVSFRTKFPLSSSAAENQSFAKAKTDALRYFLHKYPTLAEGADISSTTVDQHQLLAAANDIYAKMSPEQQNDFIFVTALNWKLATDTNFSSRISSLTSAPTLELFGLREEVIIDYESAVSKKIFANTDLTATNFKTRDESSSDENYFNQFTDYIDNNLADESKRMSRFQMSQSGLSSFDMNRPVRNSIKITMEVPVYMMVGVKRYFREKPAIGDIHLFKTDSGRYFIYSSVSTPAFLKEVSETFNETELTDMLNGEINGTLAGKLETFFRENISLDDVSTQGGYGSFNNTKWGGVDSLGSYKFSVVIESSQDLQAKLETVNSAYMRRLIDQYRENGFTQSVWEKFRDAIIPFYKRWSRSSKDPTYVHSEEDSFNDLMSLFGLFSVVGAGSSGAGKAGRALSGVLRTGRPASARAMLLLIERGVQAAAPGLREALRGIAAQLASEMFPPLDLARAARAGGKYLRGAVGRRGGITAMLNTAEGSVQSMASRNPFSAQNSVSVDISNAARYQPSGYNSVNAPDNLYIKDGHIYLMHSDGVFELDATHGGRTLRVRVPGQTPHTGPKIIHTSSGFIESGPSGLGGGKNGGGLSPLGVDRGPPIRGTPGNKFNSLSKHRTDGNPDGAWQGANGTITNNSRLDTVNLAKDDVKGVYQGARIDNPGDICWEYVVRLQQKSGRFDEVEASRRILATKGGNYGDYLGYAPKSITKADDLTNLPGGEAFAIIDAKSGKMVHAMLSVGNGQFIGLNNAGLNPALSPGKQQINLLTQLEFRSDGKIYTLDGREVLLKVQTDNLVSDRYFKTKALDKNRNFRSLELEISANTEAVTSHLSGIFQDYVTHHPIPLGANGEPKFTVSAIAFGSQARGELLLVSDIDLQLIVIAGDTHSAEARAYAKAMFADVKSKWSAIRSSFNSNPEATALQIDSVGGDEGVVVVDSAAKATELMKPKKMGGKGYSDIYADSRAIYESKRGTYQTMLERYETKIQNQEVNGLVNEALSDLGSLPPTLSSAKQTFMRPITLAVGGLYRKLRTKTGNRLPYETNTLKRAKILKDHGLIDEATYQNINEVLLRAFKWEQEAGIDSFKHGQSVLSTRASSSRTRGMYNKTRKIKQALSTANSRVDNMPMLQAPSVPVNTISDGPDILPAVPGGGSTSTQSYKVGQWQTGTPFSGTESHVPLQVDSNGPWSLVHTPGDQPDMVYVFSHGTSIDEAYTTAAPNNMTLTFSAPNRSITKNPGGQSVMNDEVIPYATVNGQNYSISVYKDPDMTTPVPQKEIKKQLLTWREKLMLSDDEKNRLLATGTTTPGEVSNYFLKPISGQNSFGRTEFVTYIDYNRVAQDPANEALIRQAINLNPVQTFRAPPKMDFLYLEPGSPGGTLEEVIEIAKARGYKNVRLTHCRVKLNETNPVSYEVNVSRPRGSALTDNEPLYEMDIDIENSMVRLSPMVRLVTRSEQSDTNDTN